MPAWWEYLNIRWLTKRRKWNAGELKMMARAARLHVLRSVMLLLLLSLLGWAGHEINGSLQAAALVDSLQTANEDAVPALIDQLGPYRRWAVPRLRSLLASAGENVVATKEQPAQLHLRLALLPSDTGLVKELKETMLNPDTTYSYVGVLRDALQPYQMQLLDELWYTFGAADMPTKRRFHAGLILATYDEASSRWTAEHQHFLAEQLVSADWEHQPRLREYLVPIRDELYEPLKALADVPDPLTEPKFRAREQEFRARVTMLEWYSYRLLRDAPVMFGD